MKNNDATIRSIQGRLLILLLRAFVAVIFLLLVFVLGTVTFFLSYPTRFTPMERLPIVTRMETYYLVTGSWDGVETILQVTPEEPADGLWERAILLDTRDRVVLSHGRRDDPLVGQVYNPSAGDSVIPLTAKDRPAGTLVFKPGIIPVHGSLAWGVLTPILAFSLFLAIFAIVIAFLLLRRVVTPLAEVIAAARSVAAGDLSARVNVSGPDDIRMLSDSFNHMAAALERQDRERRDFLADVAHELRTPLTIIRGRLEGILDGVYPADEKQVTPALEETYLLERLVEDLRLLTLAETRQLHFEPALIHPGPLARRAVDLFSAQADEKCIRLLVEDHAPEALIRADAQRTGQVVANLISNALRHTPDNGRVTLLLEQSGSEIHLSVRDSGPGVPEEDLERLFQRFWRGEKSRSRASGGAGLGLAIARQLVEAQGGRIQAANLSEGGLCITISFPTLS